MSKLQSLFARGLKFGPYDLLVIADQAAIDQVRVEHNDPNIIGHFDALHMAIIIDPTLVGNVFKVTVWHEVMHVCSWLGGHGGDEESFVTCSAPHLVHFIQENRAFMVWMAQKC